MSYTGGVQNRRKRAAERLEAQLKSGVKPMKEIGQEKLGNIPLDEKDIKRIKRELEIIKSRI